MKKILFNSFTLPVLAGALIFGACSQETTDTIDGEQVDPPPGGGDGNTTKPADKGDGNATAPTGRGGANKVPPPGPAGEYTIKEIMQQGFKADDNLKDLILDGTATAEQKAKFVDYVENLAKYQVRKGKQEDFEKRTGTLLKAARGADLAALKDAVNCKTCHEPHKIYPPKKQ
ncbi:MAG: hypothetical protein H8E27_06495 [Verrucomicrobia subdivision 3 bacterium]|nr:hypothetical protein [Limisphaerales bacterium]